MEKKKDLQKPQFESEEHDEKYDNDTSGWVRGFDKPYPNFDKSSGKKR